MKKLPLNRGYVALVDDEDYGRVSRFNWTALVTKRPNGSIGTVYAVRSFSSDGKRKQERLHRVILGVTDAKVQVDHQDHDGLNCQKYNLRIASNSQNSGNCARHLDNTSGFKGVTKHSRSKRWALKKVWVAQITVGGHVRYLGRFRTAEEAARAYDAAAIQAFGEFANTNFPIDGATQVRVPNAVEA